MALVKSRRLRRGRQPCLQEGIALARTTDLARRLRLFDLDLGRLDQRPPQLDFRFVKGA